MVKKGHRKMQKGTPLINDWDVVLWHFTTSPVIILTFILLVNHP